MRLPWNKPKDTARPISRQPEKGGDKLRAVVNSTRGILAQIPKEADVSAYRGAITHLMKDLLATMPPGKFAEWQGRRSAAILEGGVLSDKTGRELVEGYLKMLEEIANSLDDPTQPGTSPTSAE